MHLRSSSLPRIADASIRHLSPTQIEQRTENRQLREIYTLMQRFAVTESDWVLHHDLAANIMRRSTTSCPPIAANVAERAIASTRLRLTAEQTRCVRLATSSHTTIIKGGPGTGKSTTLATICAAIRTFRPAARIAVAAFAARIATATAAKCNAEPWTLHALTGMRPEQGARIVSRKTSIDPGIDTIIVDEAFTAEPALLAAIFRLCSPRQRLILAGDPEQILPIGHGRALHDLCSIGALPSITLTRGHRMAASPHLAAQIARVARGLAPHPGPGLKIIEERAVNPSEARKNKLRLARSRHDTTKQTSRSHVIITQTRTGSYGYAEINRLISGRPRPSVGDRIITTAKWPTANREWTLAENRWHNGACGQIIDDDGETITILFDNGGTVEAPSNIPCLEFTHAISGHRAQGLEYQTATLIMDPKNARLLNRQYLVSVLSRAPDLVVLTEPGILRTAAERDGLNERPACIPAVLQHRHDSKEVAT